MNIIEVKKDQVEYISQIAALESAIFPDSWSAKSIAETLENPQAKIWTVTADQESTPDQPQTAGQKLASVQPQTATEKSTPGQPQTAAMASAILGYVIFYYVLDEGEIARIATAPAHRRQGVAARLLEKMRAFSHDKNITRWLLDVRESNESAIHFYEAAGFTRDGVRKNFYANPAEDAILMSCEV